jgi:hypothetical protein
MSMLVRPPGTLAPQTSPRFPSPEYRAYRRAVEEQSVTFHEVASAWFDWHWGPDDCDACDGRVRCPKCHGRGRIHADPDMASAYEDVFHDLLDIFSKQRGGLITAYFCENIHVAAALTDIWSAADRADGPVRTLPEIREAERRRDRRTRPQRFVAWFRGLFQERASNTAIHIEPTFGDPDSPRAKQILFRCLKVHYQALEYLKPKPRKICMRMTFNVITTLLGTLDSRIGRGEEASAFDQSHADQRTLEQELESTEAYYLTAARRTARMHYMMGMLLGVPLAGAIAYLLYKLPGLPTDLSIAFAGGAVGALVSVMERLTAGKLEMNHEVGRAINVSLGVFRPFIGALFAVALYFFISGGLVSVFQLPDGAQDRHFFFAGLAFLAGFSERFAQDMVAQGKAAGAVASAPPAPTPVR